jgi:hypothetical protein
MIWCDTKFVSSKLLLLSCAYGSEENSYPHHLQAVFEREVPQRHDPSVRVMSD